MTFSQSVDLQVFRVDELQEIPNLKLQQSKSMEETTHLILGILGNVFGAAMFLAPVVTFYYVIRRRSTEEFSGIPYVVSFFNCLLDAWYGMPFVSSHNILLTICNGLGGLLEAIYVCIYLIYSPAKYRRKILGIFVAELILFGIIAVVSTTLLHGTARRVFVGILASSFTAAMYAAPLSVMKLVIETKSVEYMPFFLSLFVFLCSFSWFIFGIVERDAFVGVPNGIGALLGLTQLVLYVIYKDSSSKGGHFEGLLQNS